MATVELRRGINTRRLDEKTERYVGEQFDRGEREIIVDGIRWGRTIVQSRGSGGTRTTFLQDHYGELCENPDARFTQPYTVRSAGRRRSMWDKEPVRTTEELTLEMAQKLVADGILRHPDIVKAENARRAAEYRASRETRDREEAAAFEAKAREALQINSDEQSDLVDRVVAAMRWAQTQ